MEISKWIIFFLFVMCMCVILYVYMYMCLHVLIDKSMPNELELQAVFKPLNTSSNSDFLLENGMLVMNIPSPQPQRICFLKPCCNLPHIVELYCFYYFMQLKSHQSLFNWFRHDTFYKFQFLVVLFIVCEILKIA